MEETLGQVRGFPTAYLLHRHRQTNLVTSYEGLFLEKKHETFAGMLMMLNYLKMRKEASYLNMHVAGRGRRVMTRGFGLIQSAWALTFYIHVTISGFLQSLVDVNLKRGLEPGIRNL